jgi:type II secretory pathway pseudopilin PulG
VTLIEVLVVIAILALVTAVAIPSLRGIFDVQMTGAAKDLALSYRYMRDEASIRNVTFRVAYYLDQNGYRIEVGDANTLIFESADARQDFDDEIEGQLKRYTQRQIEEGEANEVLDKRGRFEGLSDPALDNQVQMPAGSYIAWVWTPQYDEPVEPSDDPPDDEEDPGVIAYSHIFSNGYVEHTLIRIQDIDDPDDGFTIEIEPLSGRVHVHDKLIEPRDIVSWVPEQGPEIPSL